MKVVKVRRILQVLKKDGWYLARQRGSHREFKHPTKKGVTTVNGHDNDDITASLLKSIEQQSGLKF